LSTGPAHGTAALGLAARRTEPVPFLTFSTTRFSSSSSSSSRRGRAFCYPVRSKSSGSLHKTFHVVTFARNPPIFNTRWTERFNILFAKFQAPLMVLLLLLVAPARPDARRSCWASPFAMVLTDRREPHPEDGPLQDCHPHETSQTDTPPERLEATSSVLGQ
jgi:hypothetical protein